MRYTPFSIASIPRRHVRLDATLRSKGLKADAVVIPDLDRKAEDYLTKLLPRLRVAPRAPRPGWWSWRGVDFGQARSRGSRPNARNWRRGDPSGYQRIAICKLKTGFKSGCVAPGTVTRKGARARTPQAIGRGGRVPKA